MDIMDDQLWHLSQGGDPRGISDLFVRHKAALYAFALRSTGDAERANDIVSMAFLEAWRKRHVSVEPGKVLPWLYGVTANVIRLERRSLRRWRRALAELSFSTRELDSAELEMRFEDELRVRELLDRIHLLPAQQREVMIMCCWSGLTYEEAASALGVPVGTVKSRLARARASLTDNLESAQPATVTTLQEQP